MEFDKGNILGGNGNFLSMYTFCLFCMQPLVLIVVFGKDAMILVLHFPHVLYNYYHNLFSTKTFL